MKIFTLFGSAVFSQKNMWKNHRFESASFTLHHAISDGYSERYSFLNDDKMHSGTCEWWQDQFIIKKGK